MQRTMCRRDRREDSSQRPRQRERKTSHVGDLHSVCSWLVKKLQEVSVN